MMPVAILAGGLAKRLGPETGSIPKALLDVAGQPFVARQFAMLARHGLTRVVLCVGHLGEMIERSVGDGSSWGMSVTYSRDGGTLLGTGGALRKALPLLSDRFFVLYGDSYLDCDYAAVGEAHAASGKDALMTLHRNEGRWDASNVLFTGGRILIYDKRRPDPQMRHIDYGLGVFHREALLPYPEGTVLDLATVYGDFLARDQLAGYEVAGRFYEIGSPAGLAELRRLFSQGEAP